MTGTSRDLDYVLTVAEAYLDAKSYRRADEVLRPALAADPNNPSLLTAHAQAKLGLSDHDAAAASAYSALTVAPNDEHLMRIYALALEGQGRIPEALQVAWRAAIGHPEVSLTHHIYARLLYDCGYPKQALTVVNEALRRNPALVDALVLRGLILNSLGRLVDSDADYREALRLKPDCAAAVNNLAVNRLARGKVSTALSGFLGAGGLDPSLGDLARRNVGAVLTKVLRRSTVPVVIVAITVIVMFGLHTSGQSTLIPRVIAGVCGAALSATLVWVLRSVPRRTLGVVLRQRQVLALRLALLGFALATAVVATVVGPLPFIRFAPAVLLVSAVALRFVGRMTGERLW